jgi:Tfp pilus assembly protein PilV
MRTPYATAGPRFCRWRRVSLPWARAARRSVAAGERPDLVIRKRWANETGLSLIEVLVASLITAVIAVGTLTGINAAGRSTADTRAHAQATQLAGQDEERLRGLTTTQLGQLGTITTTRAENGSCVESVSGGWHYWSKGTTTFCENPTGLSGTAYTGNVFTMTSSATYVTAETGGTKSNLTCETTGGTANYLQTTSSVTWSTLGKREPVSQSSIVTVPTSNTLLVKVVNHKNEPVEGATVTVSGVSPELTQTTPAGGCVVFGGLSSTSVKVTATKVGWVDQNTETAPAAKSVTVSKTATTEAKFTIAEPGGIRAEFVEATGSHAAVQGSTFYAFQTGIATPNGFVGGTASTYATSAEIGKVLFPFRNSLEPSKPNPYTVFAGDCEQNNPTLVNAAVKTPTAQVEPNGITAAQVELPKVTVSVNQGTSASPKGPFASVERAMIINKVCESASAARTGAIPYKHEVTISAGSLVPAFQPFAKELTLCVVVHNVTTKGYYKYTKTFENKEPTGKALGSVYPEETTKLTTAPTCP